jgi:hypothetical protein
MFPVALRRRSHSFSSPPHVLAAGRRRHAAVARVAAVPEEVGTVTLPRR